MGDPSTRRGKGCLGFIAFCIVLGVLAGLAFTLWRRTQDDALRERWKARGLPTSLAELDAWYEQVPDGENAAFAFMAAAEAIVPPTTETELQLPIVGSGEENEHGVFEFGDERLGIARAYIEKNAESLRLAHEASKLRDSRYPIRLTVGPGQTYPHLAQLRDMARHAWLQALVRTHDGNTAGAVDSFAVSYAVGRSIANEPTIISHLVLDAIEGRTAQLICSALSVRPFQSGELDRLRESTSTGRVRDAYYHAFAGEAAFALFGDFPGNGFARPMAAFDRRAYAKLVESMLDTSSLSLREMVRRIDGLYGDLAYSRIRMQIHPLTSIIAPAFVRSSDAMIRAEMYGELLVTVVAIEKYRLEYNALPERLEQLAPEYLDEIPEDPYSDGTIFYLRENPGYAVYSVGPDRVDEQAAKLTGTGGDIALHVKR